MKNKKIKKIMATLALMGVIVVIAGNIINNTTYWIFGDVYVGIVLAIVSYMLYRA